MGNALGVVQFGSKPPSAKPWKGQGPGVFEMVEDHDEDAYSAVYTVRFQKVVHVLHAFQKKSPNRIRPAQLDIDMVERRLKIAQQDHKARHHSWQSLALQAKAWSWSARCLSLMRRVRTSGARSIPSSLPRSPGAQ